LAGTAFKLIAARAIYICVPVVHIGIIDDRRVVDDRRVIAGTPVVVVKPWAVYMLARYKCPPVVRHVVVAAK
jgi:hypothetical protein